MPKAETPMMAPVHPGEMLKEDFLDPLGVSQYRLAIHLGAAILLLGAVLWIGLEYLRDLKNPRQVPRRACSRAGAWASRSCP